MAVADTFFSQVKAVPVTARPPLSTHDFADAFCVAVLPNSLDAVEIARLALMPMPRWIARLLVLRDCLVAPFRLKTVTAPLSAEHVVIGIFPIESSRADQVVLGLDDAHLDFRIVIDVADREAARMITTTTFVQTHNGLGRGYLAAVLPFHKLVVRSLLARLAGRIREEMAD